MRDYAALTRSPENRRIPRWLLKATILLLASILLYNAFAPPTWTIQRLESPDGTRTAVLSRTQYTRPHLAIKVKDHLTWHTLYLSPPLTNSPREDLHERLTWTNNSRTLILLINQQPAWQHTFP